MAIASNGGGKQALETVQRLLPVLCQAHGLTPDQVVAIASNGGGKQALETVQRLLPVLCQDSELAHFWLFFTQIPASPQSRLCGLRVGIKTFIAIMNSLSGLNAMRPPKSKACCPGR